jgi:superfamily I DNA/RNA helicase
VRGGQEILAWAGELDGVRAPRRRVRDLRAALNGTPDVRVDTMHSMKGMEFRCVLVAGVDAATVPSPGALTPREEDPVAHEQDLQRERCLLFVACTRAQDALHVSYSGSPSQFLT